MGGTGIRQRRCSTTSAAGESSLSCGTRDGRLRLPLPQPPGLTSCSRPRGGGVAFRPFSQLRVKTPPLWVLNIHEKASPGQAILPHSELLADFSLFQQGPSRRENPEPVTHFLLLANPKIFICIYNEKRNCPGRSRGQEQLKDPTAKGCGRSSSGAIG